MGDAPNLDEPVAVQEQGELYFKSKRRRCPPGYDGPAAAVRQNRTPRRARENAKYVVDEYFKDKESKWDGMEPYQARELVYTKQQRREAGRLGVRNRQQRIMNLLRQGLPPTGRFRNKMLDADGNLVDRPPGDPLSSHSSNTELSSSAESSNRNRSDDQRTTTDDERTIGPRSLSAEDAQGPSHWKQSPKSSPSSSETEITRRTGAQQSMSTQTSTSSSDSSTQTSGSKKTRKSHKSVHDAETGASKSDHNTSTVP